MFVSSFRRELANRANSRRRLGSFVANRGTKGLEQAHSPVMVDPSRLLPLAALILSPHTLTITMARRILVEGLGEVPILASAETDKGSRVTAEAKRVFWSPRYGENYPQVLWRTQLDSAMTRYAGVAAVHAGHGPSGDVALFDAQREYILAFENLVRCHLQRGALFDPNKAAICLSMTERFPGYPLEFLIDLNTEAMAVT